MRISDWSSDVCSSDLRLLIIGFTSGRIPTVSVNMPLIKGFSVVGVRAGEYGRRDPEAGRANIKAIDELASSGRIDPYVCATFPLEKAVEAMAMLQNRQAIRSEEHTSELQSLMRTSYAVFCLKNKTKRTHN